MKTVLQAIPLLLPKLVPVGLLVLGLILGFVWAYGIAPLVYTSAEPVNLGDSWKQEYIKQVAWQFATSGDSNNATNQLSYLGNSQEVLAKMIAANADPVNLTPKLQAIQQFAADNPQQMAKVTPGGLNGNLTPLLCVIGLALVVGVPIIVNTFVPITTLMQRRSTDPATVQVGLEAERRKALDAAAAQKVDYTAIAADRGAPVAQFLTTYLLNDDAFEDSFSIETPDGKFLGETGAGISKTLGTEKPKKVTAIEAWVFDINDTTTTVTKVMMSDYAFNDPALREELRAKGEPVLAAPGAITMLETLTLTIQVRVASVAYETGNTPPNSFFKQLTLELAAWSKNAATSPSSVPSAAAQPVNLSPSSPTTLSAPVSAPPASYPPPAPPPPDSSPFPPPPPNDPYGGSTGQFPS